MNRAAVLVPLRFAARYTDAAGAIIQDISATGAPR